MSLESIKVSLLPDCPYRLRDHHEVVVTCVGVGKDTHSLTERVVYKTEKGHLVLCTLWDWHVLFEKIVAPPVPDKPTPVLVTSNPGQEGG